MLLSKFFVNMTTTRSVKFGSSCDFYVGPFLAFLVYRAILSVCNIKVFITVIITLKTKSVM